MKRIILLSLYFACSMPAQSQNEGNTWYFGAHAGIDFNTVPPTALVDNQIDTRDGTAVISDSMGALLFYTNGEMVFNRDHQVMVNGTGLLGHNSSYQSAIIVPRPCHDSLYYIITSDAWENRGISGYNYSVVNMKRQGGNGEIIQKNQFLYGPSTEMLTVARHANGIDWWVITKALDNNEFYCYLVDRNGIHTTPVISASGAVVTVSAGVIRASADSKKIAMTTAGTDVHPQLFDFDSQAGTVSNAINMKRTVFPLGIEFSPDCRFLYVAFMVPARIDQFDITHYTDSASLDATKVTITPPTLSHAPRGMQFGPDGKIYVCPFMSGPQYMPYLDAIEKPNEKGLACGFRENVISLAGRNSGAMLPNIAPALLVPRFFDMEVQFIDTCARSLHFAARSNQTRNIKYHWDFGDGEAGDQAAHFKTYNNSKNVYEVTLTISVDVPAAYCGYVTQSEVIKKRIAFDSIPRFSFSYQAACENKQVKFFAQPSGNPQNVAGWYWDFGDGNTSTLQDPIHDFSTYGGHTVKLVSYSANGCPPDTIQSVVHIRAKPVANAGNDTTVIAYQPFQLKGSGGLLYEWSPAHLLNDAAINHPTAVLEKDQRFTLTVTGENGCTATDDVIVTVDKKMDIYVPNAFTPNGDGFNDVLHVFPKGAMLAYFRIFNRWGNLVFQTSDPQKGWNGVFKGSIQDPGSYVWMAKGMGPNGKEIIRKGTVILVR